MSNSTTIINTIFILFFVMSSFYSKNSKSQQSKLGAPNSDNMKASQSDEATKTQKKIDTMPISQMEANKKENMQDSKMKELTEAEKEKLIKISNVSEIISEYKNQVLINKTNAAIKLVKVVGERKLAAPLLKKNIGLMKREKEQKSEMVKHIQKTEEKAKNEEAKVAEAKNEEAKKRRS